MCNKMHDILDNVKKMYTQINDTYKVIIAIKIINTNYTNNNITKRKYNNNISRVVIYK